jgi:hypothetical protein
LWPKGQLISKCPFGIIVWEKKTTKSFLDFCHEIFCTFLGASRKLPGSHKKFQGRNPEIILLALWKKSSDQKDILKLTDL